MTGFMHIGFGIVLTTLTNAYTSVFVIGEIPFLGGVSVRSQGLRGGGGCPRWVGGWVGGCPPGSWDSQGWGPRSCGSASRKTQGLTTHEGGSRSP